ncbi:MlaA family lipoprotein [Allopusillimonas ginsengisoli]|uniref:MlaA family lipoprotein n=1 Tax=Allopusillimonas ginsengisoli TaxID=453575 RepID=UPI0010215CFE|nr:VacJ family lipoprotein [Allopusillimonas ginsengisoli]TEA77916.1 VacJ family lipoprotein [Allopusillimonas ginsengisoli]
MTQLHTPAPSRTQRYVRLAGLCGAVSLVAGCATVNNPTPQDPWESYNRSMYTFNDTLDKALLKPIASGYDQIMPNPIQTCIHNMFNNLGDVWSAANSFLQGRGHDFFNTLGRVLFNTTMGLGGCIDVASMNGSKRIVNDFGVTLGVWGLKSGPYVVLPFLGSSTVRDGSATAITLGTGFSPTTPILAIDDVPTRNAIIGLYFVDARANLLDADKLVDEIALDRYSFIRDAYLQRRKSMVDSRKQGAAAPDYSDDGLPDYSDDDLPDYSDDDAASAPAASAQSGTVATQPSSAGQNATAAPAQ